MKVSQVALLAGLQGHFEFMAEVKRIGLVEAIEGPLRAVFFGGRIREMKWGGPMTPDGAPPIATRHLCYGFMGGGGGGGGNGFWYNRPPDPAPPPPPPPPPEPPKLPEWLLSNNPFKIELPKAPDPPPPPPVMPVPDPQAQRREATKKLAQTRSRQTTRAATIIGSDDPLGG